MHQLQHILEPPVNAPTGELLLALFKNPVGWVNDFVLCTQTAFGSLTIILQITKIKITYCSALWLVGGFQSVLLYQFDY